MKKRSLKRSLWIGVCLLLLGLTARPDVHGQETAPRNVIMLISDGCGPASFTLARDYLREMHGQQSLVLDGIEVGSLRTFASNSRVTDSAASATAYACGVKTYNGAIAVDTLRRPVATLLEAAEAAGMRTGLVATSRITHATPAAYSAHVPNRGMEAEIGRQQMTQGIEVLFGGGRQYFLPQDADGLRMDGRDLMAEASRDGYTVVQDRAGFDVVVQTPVLGLFADSHMDYEIDRDPAEQPSLAEMTTKAIELLDNGEAGFFLMIEGSRIDHAGHANDAAAHLHDILAYDDAVAAALAFAEQDGQTLVVSTSDHETGGLSLGRNVNGRGVYAWNPDVLARVKHSHEYLGQRLREGMRVDEMMDMLGIDDVADDELDLLRDQLEAQDGAGLFREVTRLVGRRAVLGWTTSGHTAVDVKLYAYGPGSTHLIGNHDNTAIGVVLADLLGFDLMALSAALQTAD